jgi:VIT1/CCC1 family predicted Fe2+/Mn2+ transporter
MDKHEPRDATGLFRHYLSDLIYGANDGIITTFAVVTGVTGAALESRIVVILGLANLIADGFSMGASNFLAIRSHQAVRVADGKKPSEPFPLRHAFATFAAFVVAGSVPLISYLLGFGSAAFPIALGLTMFALFAVGAARSTVTDTRWWVAGLEMLVVGALAAAVAYFIGNFLAGLA